MANFISTIKVNDSKDVNSKLAWCSVNKRKKTVKVDLSKIIKDSLYQYTSIWENDEQMASVIIGTISRAYKELIKNKDTPITTKQLVKAISDLDREYTFVEGNKDVSNNKRKRGIKDLDI